VRDVLARYPNESTLSLLGIRVSHLTKVAERQLDLPLGRGAHRFDSETVMTRAAADRAVDTIRDRFGWEAIGYGSVMLGSRRSVPDEFRELAEKELP
jgi:DNA polymerase-4